jgi:hypothetical protein
VQFTAADRALIGFSICLAIAVACGTAAGVFVYCTSNGDGRAGATAGTAVFGAVLGALMVWRMFAGR